MSITRLDILQYRTGWMHTHPEDYLSDSDIISILSEEYDLLLETLVQDDMKDLSRVAMILRDGCDGYDNASLEELREEATTRGIEVYP